MDKQLYSGEDLFRLDHLDSQPGQAPFTRGPYASMYTQKPWTIRQYAGFATAAESNQFYRDNLAAGQHGLSVAFDLPTHRGYDSDEKLVRADVGKAGVAIDHVEDMKILFDGIALDKMSVSMTMNGAVLPIMAFFIVCAEEQGVGQKDLSGTLQNDILKEFMVRNTYIYPPEASMRIVGDIIGHCARHIPKFNPVSVSGYHMQEAGASAVQELAYTLANGLEYIRVGLESGLDIDEFAPRLSFFFGIGMDFFVEIAKLRAARTLWAQLVADKFAPKSERSLMLRTHCQTSGVSLTQHDPNNNITRTTIEALAAVLGGTQSLHTNALDEAVALPSKAAARTARNTQLILQHETAITDVIDPLGGSYYVEHLTAELVRKATSIIHDIEQQGGMRKVLADGGPKAEIEKTATVRQARIDSKADTIVGVNDFIAPDAEDIAILKVDNDAVSIEQIERLRQIKKSRDDQQCTAALNALTNACEQTDAQLLPLCIDAARARATTGEITGAMAKIFGRHKATQTIIKGVFSDAYEGEEFNNLCKRIENFIAKYEESPAILVAKLGQDGHDRGAKVIASAYSDAGFDVHISPLFQTPTEAAQMAVDSKVHVIGVSSLAGAHNSLVPELLAALRNLRADDTFVVCGGVIPPEDHKYLMQSGVKAIFGPGYALSVSANEVLDLIEKKLDEASE